MNAISVSVVVPTRNRPDHIGPCIESILANQTPNIEIVVIDQSDDDSSKLALASQLADPRLRHEPTSSRGAARARNVGIERTSGALIAFTDDDCRVPPDWVARIANVFENEPEAGVVFGRVAIPEHLKGLGFAADFEPAQREHRGSYPTATETWGIGANMSVRRTVFEQLGLFDGLLGPGSAFKAGEEVDFAIRVLAAGWKIVNAREVSLDHLGVRTGDAAGQLLRGYLFATGAVFAKHVRLGTRGTAELAAKFLALHAQHAGSSVLRGRRPSGIGGLLALLSGAAQSLSYPVDRDHKVYASATGGGALHRFLSRRETHVGGNG
jgi:glycosyltransferase involved in cell wall biosynthesis